MKKRFDYHRDRNIVCTTKGRVRGYLSDGVYCFSGIPYARAERFREATETDSWDEVLDATDYGCVAPLLQPMNMTGQLLIPHRSYTQNEQCQYLNIRTPSLETGAGLPVMVWLHGGGYFEGSSIEQDAYEGTNLAREERVVTVSLNHRLNILGYLDVAVLGEQYENSGNAGMTDLVAALQWIHDNIRIFGGDPGNVTLFGQSGGGGKIITLMQIPGAAGLFQKAIIQSGVLPVDPTPTEVLRAGNARLTLGMAEWLDLQDPLELTAVPYEKLSEAYLHVKRQLRKEGIACGGNGPVANAYYRGDPALSGFAEEAKDVTLICGSTLAEISFVPDITDRDQLGGEELLTMLDEKFTTEGAKALIPVFRKTYPDKPLSDLLVIDHMIRRETLRFTTQFSAEGRSPVYNYLFAFDFDYNGRKAAWHCSEIPFVFCNTELIPVCHVPGAEELEQRISHAWAEFARTGVPGNDWKAWEPGQGAVMIFDQNSGMLPGTDEELQELLEKYLPVFMPDFED